MSDTNRIWSEQQRAIFTWFASGTGNAMVVARAGTGKTATVTFGITQAPEEKICYLVFNKRNQLEAQGKIKDPRVEVKTLHSLGYSFIRKQWNSARPDDAVEMDRINAVDPRLQPTVAYAIKRLISWAKNTTVSLPSVGALVNMIEFKGFEPEGQDEFPATHMAEIARSAMEKALQPDAKGRISFDDMVWLPVAANWVRPYFQLICVDETQDMTLPQLVMAQKACKKSGRILVIGDDRQMIYGFRGAATNGMEVMQKELNAVVFPLTITYRCPAAVVAAAQKLVPDYQAAPNAPEGVVRALGTHDQMLVEVQVGDAILSRKNAPLIGLCLGLLRRGTPARIEGREIGKQLLAIAQKMKAGSVPEFLQKVQAWAKKQMTRASSAKNAEERIDAIQDQAETLYAVAEEAKSIKDIEDRLRNLFADTDEGPRPAVVLSSVHKSKGLEWNRTYLLQTTFRVLEGTGISEEANICYVAITRAKNILTWVTQS